MLFEKYFELIGLGCSRFFGERNLKNILNVKFERERGLRLFRRTFGELITLMLLRVASNFRGGRFWIEVGVY